jgi:hypothetical protein
MGLLHQMTRTALLLTAQRSLLLSKQAAVTTVDGKCTTSQSLMRLQ